MDFRNFGFRPKKCSISKLRWSWHTLRSIIYVEIYIIRQQKPSPRVQRTGKRLSQKIRHFFVLNVSNTTIIGLRFMDPLYTPLDFMGFWAEGGYTGSNSTHVPEIGSVSVSSVPFPVRPASGGLKISGPERKIVLTAPLQLTRTTWGPGRSAWWQQAVGSRSVNSSVF